MGVFENLVAERLPIALLKLVIINHWQGVGSGTTHVRVLTPDRSEILVSTTDGSEIDLSSGGTTYNVSIFANVVFPQPGTYWVQTFLDSEVVADSPFAVIDASGGAQNPTTDGGLG